MVLKTISLLFSAHNIAKRISRNLAFAVALTLLQQNAAAQVAPVNLGTAENFAVLAGTVNIDNTGPTTITGDIGLSPASGAFIIGFPPGVVNGTIYAVDAAGPAGSVNNPALLTIAKNDLTTAYNDAAARPATAVYAGGTDLGGLTLVSGVHNSPTSFFLTGTLTLDAQGNPNAVWIFQTGTTLITAAASSVSLINGADACNIFWQVGSSATLGTNSSFSGNVLALTSISATTGASVVGRLLARNGAVTLDTNTIALDICQALIAAAPAPRGREPRSGPTPDELARALILAAQAVDTITAPGLTSIYTLGFSQFNTEVFSLQQRFADIRAGSGPAEVPDIYSPTPIPSEKNPWSGKSPRGGKNSWGGKDGKGGRSSWGGKNETGGMGVQPPSQVQLAEDDRWGFFITGTGDFITAGASNGFYGTSYGTTLGIDYRLSDHFVVGVSIGYSHSEIDLFDDSTVKSDGVKAALYAMYQHGGFFTEGLIGGGYNNYDTKRTAFLGDARGKGNGEQFDAYLGMGYDVKIGDWTITPMASLLYTLVGINGFDEIGSLVPLKIDSQHASSLRLRVGPRVAYTTQWGGASITPSFSAQWQHELLDDELPLNARFANDADNIFTVYGPKLGRDSVLLTAALNVAWSRYAAYIAYQGDLGRKNYESHTALVGFRMSW